MYVCEGAPATYWCTTRHTARKGEASIFFWALELALFHTYFHKHLLQGVIICHACSNLPTAVFLM
jgi:hypothetical protein